jgi:hypothetical protein
MAVSTFWLVFLVFIVASRFGGRGWGWGPRRGRRINARWNRWLDDEDAVDSGRVEQLVQTVEQRTLDVELLQARVTELENRLDFTERLLAERRNAEIGSGS